MILIVNERILIFAPSTRRWSESFPYWSWSLTEPESGCFLSLLRWPLWNMQNCPTDEPERSLPLVDILLILIGHYERHETSCLHHTWLSWYFEGLRKSAWERVLKHLRQSGIFEEAEFWQYWPRTAAWTNFVSTSDGLWCVPTFSSDLTSLRTLLFLLKESVLTEIERIFEPNSWMKCLIASDSTITESSHIALLLLKHVTHLPEFYLSMR